MVLGRREEYSLSPSKLFKLSKYAQFICGHNIIEHDIPILKKRHSENSKHFFELEVIDTLFLSPLLLPKEKYHKLLKEYQLKGDYLNDPLKDAVLAKQLFIKLDNLYATLPFRLKQIYFSLLYKTPGFSGFFKYKEGENAYLIPNEIALEALIKETYAENMCLGGSFQTEIKLHPVALAYALALITANPQNQSYIPAWVIQRFPNIQHIIKILRTGCGNKKCSSNYCRKHSSVASLNRFFGFDNFRKFGDRDMQREVVDAAINGASILAVFPTGGGKSLTFQLPALLFGETMRALTVVISPLQSLMKDQVDVLLKRHENTAAVTINGLLSPLERQDAIARVNSGDAALLYLSPESLRSNRILKLLSNRIINRFVIDEAHCFSNWGQDFRVDYLYIAEFIQKLEQEKGGSQKIPISCFTATAKPAVIDDIKDYFRKKLDLELRDFIAKTERENLHYHIIAVEGEEQKIRELVRLINYKECPTIVYVARVKKAEEVATALHNYNLNAKYFHGKMDAADKIFVQDEFMDNDNNMNIVVATSAFGMGVDKDNVGLVIHYTISGSLENYIQEAGRAGRDPKTTADCYVLFDENDLDEHFALLNMTKLSHKEINQIWSGIKKIKKKNFIKSSMEIAKKAGWDTDIFDLETRVKAAIAALEQAQYIKREENVPRIYANSLNISNVEEANSIIYGANNYFNRKEEQEIAVRIVGYVISRARGININAVRIDDIADRLNVPRTQITLTIRRLKEAGILKNDKDLSVYLNDSSRKKGSKKIFERFAKIEPALLKILFAPSKKIRNRTCRFSIREINDSLNKNEIECTIKDIKDLLNYWSIIKKIKKERTNIVQGEYSVTLKSNYESYLKNVKDRLIVGREVLNVLFTLTSAQRNEQDKRLAIFSVLGLKRKVCAATMFINEEDFSLEFYEFVLLYLQHINAIELKDGFMVFYNPMRIERLEDNLKKGFTLNDYSQLARFYQSKTEQIHIVGEYARRHLKQLEALTFVNDYFVLSYEDFLSKYFNKRKTKIRQPITQKKFEQIVENLTLEQMNVFQSKEDRILVAAGPGAGKTRVLVHKIASLLLIEDVKPEQFLMLTFSRPAALELKSRLYNLVGEMAYKVDIHTYHGLAFQLLGRMGDLTRSQTVLKDAVEAIDNEDISLERVASKSVLVVDEYQDVSEQEYQLLMAILKNAEQIRMIAVGDDDQNIYEFRGASIKYMQRFKNEEKAKLFYLTKNFRSKKNIVAFCNLYLNNFLGKEQRMKESIDLTPHSKQNGQIEICKYPNSKHLVLPVANRIIKDSKQEKYSTKSIAVLTHSNDEALMIFFLLKDAGLNPILISTKDDFRLKNLLELSTFSNQIYQVNTNESGYIDESVWDGLREQWNYKFKDSSNYRLVNSIIKDFEQTNPQKSKSAWNSFVYDIRFQDLFVFSKKTIYISTMHKAKGKEFDVVHCLLNHYPLHTAEKKRVLYVAMSRAKSHLVLHDNKINFATFATRIQNCKEITDNASYLLPTRIVVQCSLNDVNLGFSVNQDIQSKIASLKGGDELKLFGDFILKGMRIGQFSRKFIKRIKNAQSKFYVVKAIKIGYIVIRYDKVRNRNYRIVLPEIEFIKQQQIG